MRKLILHQEKQDPQLIAFLKECGTKLYGDFDNSDPEEVDQLQRELTEITTPAVQEQEGFSEHNPGDTSDPEANGSYESSYSSPSGGRVPLRRLPGSNVCFEVFDHLERILLQFSLMPTLRHSQPRTRVPELART